MEIEQAGVSRREAWRSVLWIALAALGVIALLVTGWLVIDFFLQPDTNWLRGVALVLAVPFAAAAVLLGATASAVRRRRAWGTVAAPVIGILLVGFTVALPNIWSGLGIGSWTGLVVTCLALLLIGAPVAGWTGLRRG